MLDLWQNNTAVAALPQPEEGRDLPATFGESFDAAWQEGQQFSDNLAHSNAERAAFDGYLNDVQQASGEDIRKQVYARTDLMQSAQDVVGKMKAANPALMTIPDLTDDELERRTIQASQTARANYAALADREKTFGGKVGMALGGIATTALDPVNLVSAVVVPEAAVGVLGRAVLWGAFGAVSQAANEKMNAGFREQVQPGYGASGEPGANIAEAGIGGAAFGATTKLLGNLWRYMKTDPMLPTTVRDAGNVVESEANIQQSNVLPSVGGEVAHREALGKAIDDIVAGRKMDVDTQVAGHDPAASVDEAMTARGAATEATAAAQAERTTAIGELPFEAAAKEQAAEAHTATLEDWISGTAKAVGYDMPKEDAEILAQGVAKAKTDNEARSILQSVMDRPQTVADTLPSATDFAAQRRLDAEVAATPSMQSADQMRETLAAPEHEAALRADIERAQVAGNVRIPAGVDEQGEPVYRSLDSAMNEVDGYKAAAEQIQACANPVSETSEADAGSQGGR